MPSSTDTPRHSQSASHVPCHSRHPEPRHTRDIALKVMQTKWKLSPDKGTSRQRNTDSWRWGNTVTLLCNCNKTVGGKSCCNTYMSTPGEAGWDNGGGGEDTGASSLFKLCPSTLPSWLSLSQPSTLLTNEGKKKTRHKTPPSISITVWLI